LNFSFPSSGSASELIVRGGGGGSLNRGVSSPCGGWSNKARTGGARPSMDRLNAGSRGLNHDLNRTANRNVNRSIDRNVSVNHNWEHRGNMNNVNVHPGHGSDHHQSREVRRGDHHLHRDAQLELPGALRVGPRGTNTIEAGASSSGSASGYRPGSAGRSGASGGWRRGAGCQRQGMLLTNSLPT
jgi:hypothetical protein